MFALIDSADLLLDPVSAIREANFDLVDIFGDSLDVEDVGVAVGRFVLVVDVAPSLSLVDDVLVIPNHFLQFRKGV